MVNKHWSLRLGSGLHPATPGKRCWSRRPQTRQRCLLIKGRLDVQTQKMCSDSDRERQPTRHCGIAHRSNCTPSAASRFAEGCVSFAKFHCTFIHMSQSLTEPGGRHLNQSMIPVMHKSTPVKALSFSLNQDDRSGLAQLFWGINERSNRSSILMSTRCPCTINTT